MATIAQLTHPQKFKPHSNSSVKARLICALLNHLQEDLLYPLNSSLFMTGSFKRSVHYERRPVASPIGSLTVQTYGLEYVQGLWVIDYGIDLVKESRPDGAVYTINAKIKGLDLNGKGLKDMEAGVAARWSVRLARTQLGPDGNPMQVWDSVKWEDILRLLRRASVIAFDPSGEERDHLSMDRVWGELGDAFKYPTHMPHSVFMQWGAQ